MLLSRTAWGLFFDGVPTPKRLRLADPKWDAPAKPVKVKKSACRAETRERVRLIVLSPSREERTALRWEVSRCAACGRCKVPPA